MGKSAKTFVKTAVGVTAVFFAVGEVAYERILNRRFTSQNNNCRVIEPEVLQYYGKPELQADADSWFVSMKPEDTFLVGSLGKKMHANIFMQKEYTDKWAIVIHGYTSSPRGMAPQGRYFYKKGFNVIMPTLMSFGKDEQKYCSMGYYDRYYIKDWVNYILSIDCDAKIALLGVSMGSATTMLVTGEEDLPLNVKCAVADCGYTSCWDEFTTQCKVMYKVPSYPVMNFVNTVSKLRGNFDFKKCSPLEAVAKSVTPTLFIHGENDTFVPYPMMAKLFDACTAEKEKLSVPDATHANSCDVHPEIYFPAIDKFVDRYIK